jgi:hypothetical protein
MLDVNIYKRDLEMKCIDSDAQILNMESDMTQLRKQME